MYRYSISIDWSNLMIGFSDILEKSVMTLDSYIFYATNKNKIQYILESNSYEIMHTVIQNIVCHEELKQCGRIPQPFVESF